MIVQPEQQEEILQNLSSNNVSSDEYQDRRTTTNTIKRNTPFELPSHLKGTLLDKLHSEGLFRKTFVYTEQECLDTLFECMFSWMHAF
jgi:hypothetical protein